MTIALKVSPQGDMVLDGLRRMAVISGTEKAVQDIAIILRSLKGSFHFNAGFGTDHVAIVASERDVQVATSEINQALSTYTPLESYTVSCTFDQYRHLLVGVAGTLNTGDQIFLEESL